MAGTGAQQEFLQHITNNLVCCLLGLIVWCCVEVFFPDFFDYPYLFIPFTWYDTHHRTHAHDTRTAHARHARTHGTRTHAQDVGLQAHILRIRRYNLGRFWLLFAYAAVLCVAYNWLLPQPTSLRRTIFLWSAANSILAVCSILASFVSCVVGRVVSCVGGRVVRWYGLTTTGRVAVQGLLEECGFRFLYICTAMLSILAVDYAIKGAWPPTSTRRRIPPLFRY
jgi:hypothetical protein